jgi:hypothetical protein
MSNNSIKSLFFLGCILLIAFVWWSWFGFPLEGADKWITAVATLAIGLFTFTLWQSTDKLWSASEKQFGLSKEVSDRQAIEIQNQLDLARISARAAEQSAKAAIAAERARLYVNIDGNNFMECINDASAYENTPSVDEHPLRDAKLPKAEIKFTNYGKSPAVVVEVGLSVFLADKEPHPTWTVKIVKQDVVAPNQSSETFTEMIGAMTMGQAKKIRDGLLTIWIAGYVIYDDVFGERRTHRFLRRWVAWMPRIRFILQSYDYKHYNLSD